MNKHQKFLEFNGKNLLFLNRDGQYYIAVKPICEALNVVYTGQLKRLKNHPILGPALYICTMQVPGKAGFQARKMTCIPEWFVYGWIFSIASDKPELVQYQKTCYELLYNHFHGTITNRKELLVERSAVDTELHEIKKQLRESGDENFKKLRTLKSKRKLLSTQLNTIDKELVEQPTLFGKSEKN